MNSVLAISTAKLYLPAMLAMVALPFFIALGILFTRLRDLSTGSRELKFYEEYSGIGGPMSVQRTTNQLTNLFEFPMLLYIAIIMAITCGLADTLLNQLLIIFVAGRWGHSVVHLFLNRLWLRTPLFMISNIVLLAIWIRLALLLFGLVPSR